MTALNDNTLYCHLVDTANSNNLKVPGTVTATGGFVGATTGTSTGDVVVATALKATAADHKLGFYSIAATPIIQPTVLAAAATITAGATPPTGDQFNAAVTVLNSLITKIQALGLIASS